MSFRALIAMVVPLLSVVSFFMLSATHSQLRSENIAWKIPEMNNS